MSHRRTALALAVAALLAQPQYALSAQHNDLDLLRKQIEQLKQDYEARIRGLEARLQQTEAAVDAARSAADEASPQAKQAASAASDPDAAPAGPGAASANAFNPQISLILSGTYSRLSRDPSDYRISGFMTGDDIGPGDRSFSLGESELGIYANIDPWFYGGASVALEGDNSVSVEEAFIQTTALPHGLRVKAGRFFSGVGYLNEQHAHTWDFIDNPLAYQAFLGTQLGHDGVQLKWLAPTDTFVEFGAEVARGDSFPGSEHDDNGAGIGTLFAHVGGDVGTDGSWRAGISYLRASPDNREFEDVNLFGEPVTNGFTGRSQLWIADFVWKWAPDGNAARTHLKLQAEYFRRRESGDLRYDTANLDLADRLNATQSGWYVQGVYQFMPRWRTGLRYDRLDVGDVDYASNNAFIDRPNHDPSRVSWMIDWNPSEFSRIRLQLARDRARQDAVDNQLFLQYQMSLGAHGAHSF
jgi:hypothetical protein